MNASAPLPKKVMVVEDSPVCRLMIEHIIESDPRLRLVSSVASGEEALRVVSRVAPDVISMDIGLPGMDGVETAQRLMATHPTPIVVISASVDKVETDTSMRALQAGALCVLEKPGGLTRPDFEERAREIRTQLFIMSEVKVLRRRAFGTRYATPAASVPVVRTGNHRTIRLIGIAASTGGPQALVKVLNGLGDVTLPPILILQHIGDSFLDGFVSWLDSVVPQTVVKAAGGIRPEAGMVYVAAPHAHLVLRENLLALQPGEPVCGQLPSADPLFDSMSSLGPAALGVILTGMGEDGARGLLALRQAGAHTIAEDESTAVVFGMPGAAQKFGAACEMRPLDRIPSRVLELTSPTRLR